MKPKRPANLPPAITARPYGSAFRGLTKLLTFILLLLAGTPLTIHADCDVTFQWDSNNPVPEGYRLYGREEGQYFDYDNAWWQGNSTFTQCTIDGLSENEVYFFIVRAFTGGITSADSNEVSYTCGDSDHLNAAGGGSSSGCFIQTIFR
jgi:hypothetical protein